MNSVRCIQAQKVSSQICNITLALWNLIESFGENLRVTWISACICGDASSTFYDRVSVGLESLTAKILRIQAAIPKSQGHLEKQYNKIYCYSSSHKHPSPRPRWSPQTFVQVSSSPCWYITARSCSSFLGPAMKLHQHYLVGALHPPCVCFRLCPRAQEGFSTIPLVILQKHLTLCLTKDLISLPRQSKNSLHNCFSSLHSINKRPYNDFTQLNIGIS